MRTLYCDYLVAKSKPAADGVYWGVISITNHNNIEQIAVVSIMDYYTGKEIKKKTITLLPKQSILFDNNDTNGIMLLKDVIGRVRVYIDCSNTVTATIGNSKGTNSAISWERMIELPFPKSLP